MFNVLRIKGKKGFSMIIPSVPFKTELITRVL